MRWFAFIIATLLLTGAAMAQVGGNGVTKATANTLGYLQFITPPPGTNLFPSSTACKGWPFPSFGQQRDLAGGAVVLYDGSGRPHYFTNGC